MFYFAKATRCPSCGTQRLRRLTVRDGIDSMHRNLFTFTHRLFGARLYHCRFCRIQFYDIPRGPQAFDPVPLPANRHRGYPSQENSSSR
jgi:hypothetical protein